MPAGILKVETSKGLADSYAECVEDSPISVQSQTAFTCSKLTIETLEQCVNLFKVNNKNNRTSSIDVVRLSLLSTMNIFYGLFLCFHCCLWTSKFQLRCFISNSPPWKRQGYRKGKLTRDGITEETLMWHYG